MRLHNLARTGENQRLCRMEACKISVLRAAGIIRLSLFGSTARDEARADSDIDLLAAFDDARGLSLLDVIGIENKLADLLGRPVDLIEEGTLRPRARQSASREAVRAF
jgi:predicted nucleotidyltransferase